MDFLFNTQRSTVEDYVDRQSDQNRQSSKQWSVKTWTCAERPQKVEKVCRERRESQENPSINTEASNPRGKESRPIFWITLYFPIIFLTYFHNFLGAPLGLCVSSSVCLYASGSLGLVVSSSSKHNMNRPVGRRAMNEPIRKQILNHPYPQIS